MSDKFDVVVIGSGPGGYVCAIRCAQLGMKTAIVERYPTLGGTCLNVGCIPSKALLDSSERYHETVESHSEHGINVSEVKLDFPKMMNRVQSVVDQTCGGVKYLMDKNKIQVFHGHGSFKDKNTILVKGDKEQTEIKTDKVVIATGSKPSTLPGMEIDKKRVISSTEALKLKEVPKHMIVIGGGVIGLELGSAYRRLGSKVSVVEYADSIIGTMDSDMGKQLQRVLKKDGVEFYTGHQVTSVENKGKEVVVKAKNRKKENEIELKGDYCLVSVGRRPYTDSLGLDNIGIELDERGRIPVESHLKTKVDNVYAIGDVVVGAMLAHKAEEEGVYVAEHMTGQKPHINYLLIPGVVYTWPEVASVGYTEEQLKAEKMPYKKGSFPFKALGRARASNESDGLIKVLAHKETDEILGVHMIGPRCADLIGEAVVAMEYKASAEDIARISHAHPTYTEAFKEACLAATENRALHV
ncbi:MAG: dihydrolipoyl dehydrogenase [Halobacteriovoraceae bacterium]|nr:dihydrolipoyl dehydrogenase [Halobacteriovoraceae bacterium]|tara:strand:- start:119556 stop:120962 length:1407 start_codon:yes stop_codon:yes gene_type:complete